MDAQQFKTFEFFVSGVLFLLAIVNAAQYKKRPRREYFFPIACLSLCLGVLFYALEVTVILTILFAIVTVVMLVMDQMARNAPPPKERKPQSPTKKGFDL